MAEGRKAFPSLNGVRYPADLVREFVVGQDTGEVWLHDATIVGILDLTGTRAASGEACNGLVLDSCVLEGHPDCNEKGCCAGLDVRHSHLRRLSLRGCQTDGVDLTDAQIDGSVDLDQLRARDGQKNCWVRARGVRLGSSLTARGAKLSLPPWEEWPLTDRCEEHKERHWPDVRRPCALDLFEARIGGSLELLSGFKCGGINLSSATIGAELRILDGEINPSGVGRFTEALWAQYVQVEGPCFLGIGGKDLGQLTVTGAVWLYGSKIGGALTLEQTKIVGAATDGYNLSLYNATIGGDLFLQPSTVENVDLMNASVAGDANVWSAEGQIEVLDANGFQTGGQLQLSGEQSKVRLISATIGGDLFLQPSTAGQVDLMNTAVTGEANIGSTEGPIEGLDARGFQTGRNMNLTGELSNAKLTNATIGGDLSLQPSTVGHVSLMNTAVAGEATVGSTERWLRGLDASGFKTGRDLKLTGELSNVNLASATIGGDLKLEPWTVRLVDLTNASVAGDTHVGGRVTWIEELDARGLQARGDLSLAGGQSNVDLAGSSIGGSVSIGNGDTSEPLRLIGIEGNAAKLTLEGAEIGRNLKVIDLTRGIADKKPLVVRSKPIKCAPGWNLAEAYFSTGFSAVPNSNWASVNFLYHAEDSRAVVLDGTRERIDALNPKLRLTDETEVREYLELFCANIWADEGPFRIVPGSLLNPKLEDAVWYSNAHVLYGSAKFEAKFKIEPEGEYKGDVEMLDDDEIEDDLPISEFYDAPYRWHKQVDDNHNSIPEVVPDSDWDGQPPEGALWVALEPELQKEPAARPEIDLTGLRTFCLDDKGGKAWFSEENEKLPLARLRLAGFAYERVADTNQRAGHQPIGLQAQLNASAQTERAGPGSDSDPVNVRKRWLEAQFDSDQPGEGEFRPEPYYQLAKVLRAAGDFDAADDITIRRLELEKIETSTPDDATGFQRMWLALKRLGWKAIRMLFGFGLKPPRAFVTVAVFWAAGIIAMFALSGWLKVDPQPVGAEVDGAEQVFVPKTNAEDSDTEVKCGSQVNEIVYPIDVIIPFVDLRQEGRCHFSNDAWPLTILKAGYAVVGWIIISMFIYTVSGFGRRRLES